MANTTDNSTEKLVNIKMTVSVSGAYSYPAGKEVAVPAEQAKELIAAGYAIPLAGNTKSGFEAAEKR